MEVEAKFRVPDEEAFQRLLELDSLAGLHLAPVPPVEVSDRYFDTPDRDLWTAGVACRVRIEGIRALGTVKGLGKAEGAIHRRLEYEVELEHAVTPDSWPAGEPRALVQRLSHGKPLHPLFDLEQQRHRRIARDATMTTHRDIAEISLDRVCVRHGETTIDRYLEIEAELLPDGSVEDLNHVAEHLAGRWGLVPQPLSKFERAMSLFQSAWVEGEDR